MSNIDTLGYGRSGRIFTASNVSAKIITVVGTSMTGLILYNPVGSGKYLSFMSAGYALTTALASLSSICIAISPSQPVIPSSNTVGSAVVSSATGSAGAASVAKAWDVSTLGVACVAARWFGGKQWVTGGTAEFVYQMSDKIDGELGLVPGAAACFAGIGGTLPTGMGSISFVEIDA
jgi:hypothetical protein